jgi:hypothetical protein
MLVSSFNLSQSFNYTPYLFFYKIRFKSEINYFCIWTLTKYSAIPSWRSDLDGESLGLLAATAPGRHLTDLTLSGNAATFLTSGGEVLCCCQLPARFSGQFGRKKSL